MPSALAARLAPRLRRGLTPAAVLARTPRHPMPRRAPVAPAQGGKEQVRDARPHGSRARDRRESVMRYDSTGMRCPKCGQTGGFTVSPVILWGTTRITPEGWDYVEEDHDVDFAPESEVTCCECGATGSPEQFLCGEGK